MQVSERQVQTRSPTRCCPMIGWKCWSVIEGYEWRHFSYKKATQNSVVQLELTLQVTNIWSLGQRGNDSGINVTVKEYQGQTNIHILYHHKTKDEDRWYPTKKGWPYLSSSGISSTKNLLLLTKYVGWDHQRNKMC